MKADYITTKNYRSQNTKTLSPENPLKTSLEKELVVCVPADGVIAILVLLVGNKRNKGMGT